MIKTIILSSALVVLFACELSTGEQYPNTNNEQQQQEQKLERQFWQDGKAEVSVYELEQNRYNAIHPGKLVNVFVLEDFLVEKQVKNETYQNPNSTQVLKNIRSTKFTTGIYDYALHTSVFTPLDVANHPTLKVTNTMQEWCGTTFLQMNYEKENYIIEQRSYFEKEGDRRVEVQKAVVEDALMNQIRMDYEKLPLGKFELISKLSYTALMHKPLTTFSAVGELKDYSGSDFAGEQVKEYRYRIESQEREVSLFFESVSPYKIVGFKESYPSAFDGEIRTTTAKLISSERLAYWGMNSVKDVEMRNKIGL